MGPTWPQDQRPQHGDKLAMSQDIDQIKDIGLWEDSLTVSDQSIKNDVLLGMPVQDGRPASSPRRFNPPARATTAYLIPAAVFGLN